MALNRDLKWFALLLISSATLTLLMFSLDRSLLIVITESPHILASAFLYIYGLFVGGVTVMMAIDKAPNTPLWVIVTIILLGLAYGLAV